jgi:tellurite resistance protein TerA
MTSAVRTLRPGEALPLADLGEDESADLAVALTASGQLPDIVALLVSQTGKVRSDDDLVFYNNTASTDTAVSWTGRARDAEWICVAPGRLDTDVDRIVLGCAGGLLDVARAGSLTLTVGDVNGRVLATATFPAESDFRAMILIEIYRRNGQWRCRLLAQGYAGGLAALVTEFGVEVDDPGEGARPAGAYPAPAPPAMPARAGAIPHGQPEPTPSVATPPGSSPSPPAPTAPPAHLSPSPSAPPTTPWTTQPAGPNDPRQPIAPPPYSPAKRPPVPTSAAAVGSAFGSWPPRRTVHLTQAGSVGGTERGAQPAPDDLQSDGQCRHRRRAEPATR